MARGTRANPSPSGLQAPLETPKRTKKSTASSRRAEAAAPAEALPKRKRSIEDEGIERQSKQSKKIPASSSRAQKSASSRTSSKQIQARQRTKSPSVPRSPTQSPQLQQQQQETEPDTQSPSTKQASSGKSLINHNRTPSISPPKTQRSTPPRAKFTDQTNEKQSTTELATVTPREASKVNGATPPRNNLPFLSPRVSRNIREPLKTIPSPIKRFLLTRPDVAETLIDVADYYHDNPSSAVPCTEATHGLLKVFNEHHKQQQHQALQIFEAGGEIQRETAAETPSDPSAEPTTPSGQRGWATYLDPRNLLRTPLTFFTRRRREQPATESRANTQKPEAIDITPKQQQSLAAKPPATISHPPPKTTLSTQQTKAARIKSKELTLASLRRAGKREDSHLPIVWRGCTYEELPDHWQKVSQHMRREPSPSRNPPPAPPSSMSKRRNLNEGNKSSERPDSFNRDKAWRAQEQKIAGKYRYMNEHPPKQGQETTSNAGIKRKRSVKVYVPKVFDGHLEHSTYSVPENFYESSSEEEIDIEMDDYEEESEVDERELLAPDSPSNQRILTKKSILKNTKHDKTQQRQPPLDFTPDFAVPEYSSDEDSDGNSGPDERPSKRARHSDAFQQDKIRHSNPTNYRQPKNETFNNIDQYNFSDVSDEEDWDIDENTPEIIQAWSLKNEKPWLAMLNEIRQHALNDRDAAERVSAFKKWWKQKKRYEKKYNSIAYQEIKDLNYDLSYIPLGPWGAMTLKKHYYDHEHWPTPLAREWDELHPFSLHPPKAQPPPPMHKSVTFEQSQRPLTPDEFGDPHKARPYSGTMLKYPSLDKQIEERQSVYDGTSNDPSELTPKQSSAKEVEALEKVRQDVLRHRPKVPSGLSNTQTMSPLQPISGNAGAATLVSRFTTSKVVLDAFCSFPESSFAFKFLPDYGPPLDPIVQKFLEGF